MFINLTPHRVVLPTETVEPTLPSARCVEISTFAKTFNHVECIHRDYGEVFDLPGQQDGVMYIVSSMVRLACPHRNDLASPGDLVRDTNGQIIGCKNLIVNQ